MYNMPFFGFPYYKNYYSNAYFPRSNSNFNNYYNWKNINNSKSKLNYENLNNDSDSIKNSATSNSSRGTVNDNSRFNNKSDAFINILGINLYSDDILILCILLSLYLEGVKDEMLFISLILLLLS